MKTIFVALFFLIGAKSLFTFAQRGSTLQTDMRPEKLFSFNLDDDRTSGVLPAQALRALARAGRIESSARVADDAIQPASIDLSLGSVAYRLQASFLPQKQSVIDGIKPITMYQVDLGRGEGAILEKNAVYLIPLRERLDLPATIFGRANPKSSIGRLDIFTRCVTDYGSRFEEIPPQYKGALYLEVVPRSFAIRVREGDRLNQVRLIKVARGGKQPNGAPTPLKRDFLDHESLSALDVIKFDAQPRSAKFPLTSLEANHSIASDGVLMSVDLASSRIIGYKAKKNSLALDLRQIGHYRLSDFWESIPKPSGRRKSLILEPEEFYILASKEFLRVPSSYAAEMVEFDSGAGELRTHYAGFFDPGFGGERGAKAVLEVRAHDVPFIIEDGQTLFKMKYERTLAEPDRLYGADIGSNYHDQRLKLSKLFIDKSEKKKIEPNQIPLVARK